MKRILIIGREGQIGWELQRSLATLGTITAVDKEEIDLANADSMINFIREMRPQIIVNAAAYTAVDQAEADLDNAMMINGTAPGILAEEARRLGASFVHYSTDYVFNGKASEPYKETDPTDPLSVYGKSKLAGELAVQNVGGHYLILRTSWIYGMRGKNFLLTMLKLGKERDQLKVVIDQVGAPTWCRYVAEITSHILLHCRDEWGLYHVTSAGETSWHGFATKIFQMHQALNPSTKIPEIIPIPSNEFPSPVKRPAYSVLSNEKIKDAFGVLMPSWETGLELCLKK